MSLLLAVFGAASPIPAVAPSATPEAIASFPPVHAANGSSDWVALWTLNAAIAAAVIGLLTLAAVGWQIWLAAEALRQAQRELVAAENQLRLTQESNTLVLEELDYSRAQAQDVRRKAILSVWNNRQRITAYRAGVSGEEDPVTMTVNLWLQNDGDRTARDATIFLWLPWPEWRVPGWSGILNPEEAFAQQGFRTIANVELNGRRYWNVSVDVPFPTYPKVARLALTFKAVLPIGFKDAVLWRVGYDDGIEPAPHEPEGRLDFEIIGKLSDGNLESQV